MSAHSDIGEYSDTLSEWADSYRKLAAENEKLKQELEVTDKLLENRERVMAAIPECPVHGSQCVPHAIEWVEKVTAENKQLREINEAQAMDAWAHEVYLEKIAGLEAELERLRAALRPFADIHHEWEAYKKELKLWGGNLKLSDLLPKTEDIYKQAADALEPEAVKP